MEYTTCSKIKKINLYLEKILTIVVSYFGFGVVWDPTATLGSGVLWAWAAVCGSPVV